MKKYFYLMALVAMAGFVYTSCSEDDDDSSVNVSLPTPATKELAAKYAIEDPSQSYQTVIDDVNVALTEFEVTEDNGIILKYDEVGPKAAQIHERRRRQIHGNRIWRHHRFDKHRQAFTHHADSRWSFTDGSNGKLHRAYNYRRTC